LAVHYLLDKEWFDPLAAGIDVLPEKHAYSHTIGLSSGAQAYLHLGDAKYLKALTNAWRFLEPQRYASGGWAPEEQFVHLGQGKLAASLESSKAHFETPCGSFADLKLARYLIRFTGVLSTATGWSAPCTTPFWRHACRRAMVTIRTIPTTAPVRTRSITTVSGPAVQAPWFRGSPITC
jgi:hypothetical protein